MYQKYRVTERGYFTVCTCVMASCVKAIRLFPFTT